MSAEKQKLPFWFWDTEFTIREFAIPDVWLEFSKMKIKYKFHDIKSFEIIQPNNGK